ncbi:hypothetical protein M433DRAFT_9529 [Acidomyces richmondensis BFW]|nr:hypothetical protein M433DRAFT_9529 [Acidomyces richmondensis BFW]
MFGPPSYPIYKREMQTGSLDVQKSEEEKNKSPYIDYKAGKIEQADRDTKKPKTPRHQWKGEEGMVAPRTIGKGVGPRKKEKRTGPSWTGNTSSMDYIKKRRRRIKDAQRLD